VNTSIHTLFSCFAAFFETLLPSLFTYVDCCQSVLLIRIHVRQNIGIGMIDAEGKRLILQKQVERRAYK
jgi:hypothetical protein